MKVDKDSRQANFDGDENAQRRKKKSRWDDDPAPVQLATLSMVPRDNPGILPENLKPEMCGNFMNGHCTEAGSCMFAHSLRELVPGGMKPRLCPAFLLPGGCPRQGLCYYAHKKEELPFGFKTTLCHKWQNGNCRAAKMCKLAHGDEEKNWFTEFMQADEQQATVATFNGGAPNMPLPSGQLSKAPGVALSSSPAPASAPDPNVASAQASFLLQIQAQNQAMLAQTFGTPTRPKAAPSHIPKLNLAKLPASMKAPGGWPQGGAPTGLESFAKKASAPMVPGPMKGVGKGTPLPAGRLGAAVMSTPPSMSPPSMSPPSMSPPGITPPGLLGKASAPANPMAAEMAQRLGALQNKASRGICLQFEMGGCTKDNCQLSHDLS